MASRGSGRDGDDDRWLGAIATGRPVRGVLGLLRSGGSRRSSLDDLGPAPIGSDPWLEAEVRAALARELGGDASAIDVEVHEMVVTLRGAVPSDDATKRAERAASSIEGVARVQSELTITR
ncbi:MAG: BON domain-containing protein [Myxococcota bacterium]|nr:BON domain-containing protein [Myxococcota bacterium]